MTFFAKVDPSRVMRGKIVGAFQNLCLFEVAVTGGRYWCTANVGDNLSVSEVGGYSIGQDVWIALQLNSGEGFIICAAGDVKPDIDVSKALKDYSFYPRVAGGEFNKGLAGALRAKKLVHAPNYGGHGVVDLVDGEWGRVSPYGPGVIVELFRSILRGGPFATVEAFNEEEGLVRIAASRIEEMSLHREREDGRLGSSAQVIDRKVLYPVEAVEDLPHREIVISGPAHGGEHTYLVPQPGDQEPGISNDAKASRRLEYRPGLLHEFRGIDGAYLLESARSVTFRKTCTIRTPEELRPTTDELLTIPRNNGNEIDALVNSPRIELSNFTTTPDPEPGKPAPSPVPEKYSALNDVVRMYEFLENLKWRSRGVLNRLDKTWVIKQQPQSITGVKPTSSSGSVTVGFDTSAAAEKAKSMAVDTRSTAMWQVTPRSYPIWLDKVNGTKTYYVGTSTITLQPTGGIILEDAYHSQIIMDKGNIRISAAKDLVLESGRNTLMIAGQDAGMRVYRHLDIASNTGRVCVKADGQLNLLGGNGGTGGVLIENRSTTNAPSTGGDTVQTSGSLVLLSSSDTCVLGNNVLIKAATDRDNASPANGSVTVASEAATSLVTATAAVTLGTELVMSFNGKGGVIGGDRTVLHAITSDQICDLAADGAADAIKAVDASAATQLATLQLATPINWRDGHAWDSYGFRFGTTTNYSLGDAATFELFETSWQIHAPTTTGAPAGVWQESPVSVRGGNPTAPFPGLEAWSTETRLIKIPASRFYDPATGTLDTTLDTIDASLSGVAAVAGGNVTSSGGQDTTLTTSPGTANTGNKLAVSEEVKTACTLGQTTTVTINGHYTRGSNV